MTIYVLFKTVEKGQSELDRVNAIDQWANLEEFPNCTIENETYLCGFEKPYQYILNQLDPELDPDLEAEFDQSWRGEQPPE
jgi:hypothetical protein